MKRLAFICAAIFALSIGLSGTAPATVIDFTGGTATLFDGSTVVTNNTGVWGPYNGAGVDFYEENGFKLDFIGGDGIVGDYYGANNDVIHGHWATGAYGTLTEIRVTKLDSTPFDLNYFILTSNTDTGGGAASGNEQTYIHSSNGYSQLLPSDDWGFAGLNPQILLDSNFDNITWFSFTAANRVDCFGMDNFYIDEPAPVPEPSSLLLLGGGLMGFVILRKRFARG